MGGSEIETHFIGGCQIVYIKVQPGNYSWLYRYYACKISFLWGKTFLQGGALFFQTINIRCNGGKKFIHVQ